MAVLLTAEGFSLQGTWRTTERTRHPDRDTQFHYINNWVNEFTAAGQPDISVGAKKKGALGDYAIVGGEWHPTGRPVRVRPTTCLK